MRDEMQRTIYSIIQDGDDWTIESGGEILERRASKDDAHAAAHRRARRAQEKGHACMVRVSGESGFATQTNRDAARGGPAVRPGSRLLPRV